MCIVPTRLRVLCSKGSLYTWLLNSWRSTSPHSRSSEILDGWLSAESNVAGEQLHGYISIIYLLSKIQRDNFCLSSLTLREKTYLQVGQQAHENCFGRGQGVDGVGWAQDAQVVPEACFWSIHLANARCQLQGSSCYDCLGISSWVL